ncbi:CZB domain-containing protein [Telmatobacter bradus]|uniref:CZB domain-containing protein n=1 Tax=Telmatobacter bradus TaxID=474953 RepID=UPI003B42AB72
MDLNSAIQKHAEWKFKFRSALHDHQTMDSTAISKDSNCELGKWLHCEAATLFGKYSSHARCLSAHAIFHVEAGKVAVHVAEGNQEKVEQMIANGSPFSEASKKVSIAIIMELKGEIGSKAK